MASLQMRAQNVQILIRFLVVAAHLVALIICTTFLYLGWDGGQVIRQVMESKGVSAYSPETYRAVYDHYFGNLTEPGWAPLSLFIGFSNVVNLYSLAPTVLILTTFLLSRRTPNRWKWLVVGPSLVVGVLLLSQAHSLRYLATILD